MSKFTWKGTLLATLGDLVDAVGALETREEAQEFMRQYGEHNEHAVANVGYITGYLDNATGQRIREWCAAPHPIFGMSTPTPEEAYAAGVKRGLGSG